MDIRSLRPLDHETVLESVAKTNRIMVVEEGPRVGGWAGNLLGIVVAEGLDELDDAWIVTTRRHAGSVQPDARGRLARRCAPEIAAAVRERLGVSAAS